MSIYDRDWYREDFKKKEEEYGGDFSLHSKKKQGRTQTRQEYFHNKEADYSDMQEKETEGEWTIIPAICPKCDKLCRIRMKKKLAPKFEFTCPHCNNRIVYNGKYKVKSNLPYYIGMLAALFYGIYVFCEEMATGIPTGISTATGSFEIWFPICFGLYHIGLLAFIVYEIKTRGRGKKFSNFFLRFFILDAFLVGVLCLLRIAAALHGMIVI